ncbi:MAG TPA: tripartite tricarboxylate transporter substrate-binding protein [Candidatus Binatia bacterium]
MIELRVRTGFLFSAWWYFLLVLALLLSPVVSHAASYYESKTVTIVVGYKSGGGYDRTARLLAKHLPKYIPGSPTVVVQNMDGSNSMIAANHIYSAAKPDGLTIGAFNRNLPIAQLIRVEGIRFDMTKYSWIGSAASETTVLTVRSDLPFKTFEDVRKSKQQVTVGSTGPGANNHDFPLLLEEFAGVNFKIVPGYSSSADVTHAIERKEIDAWAGSYSTVKPYIDRGLIRAVVRSRGPEPDVVKLPLDEDLATSAKGKAIMAIRSAPERIGRPFVAPPGTPAETMKILREAFAKVARDKELLDEAQKAKMVIDYVSAEECLKIVREVLNQPAGITQDLTKYIKFGE